MSKIKNRFRLIKAKEEGSRLALENYDMIKLDFPSKQTQSQSFTLERKIEQK